MDAYVTDESLSSLHGLVARWEGRAELRDALLHVFTSAHQHYDQQKIVAAFAAYASLTQNKVGFAGFEANEPIKVNVATAIPTYNATGMGIVANARLESFPSSGYMAVLSPTLKEEIDDSALLDAITSAAGFLIAFFSPSIAHAHAFNVRLSLHGDPLESAMTNTIEQFQTVAECPCSIATLDQLRKSMAGSDVQLRQRIQLTFLFVGRGYGVIESSLRFFDLWTALEVVYGSYRKLVAAIDHAHDRPEWRSQMLALKDRRTNLVHAGMRPRINQDDETLMRWTIVKKALDLYGLSDAELDQQLNAGTKGVQI